MAAHIGDQCFALYTLEGRYFASDSVITDLDGCDIVMGCQGCSIELPKQLHKFHWSVAEPGC